jgi:hypothetical protein
MKPFREMSFREQIGLAAKNGAYSKRFREIGFGALTAEGEAVTVSPETFESWVSAMSPRDVGPAISFLRENQPTNPMFADWSMTDLLKLRAYLALRLGDARRISRETKDLALARTYLRDRWTMVKGESPYRDDGPGFKISRSERAALYEDIARQIETQLTPIDASSAITASTVAAAAAAAAAAGPGEQFLIEHAFDLYTFPSVPGEKLQVSKTVSVRALEDGLREYRYTIETTIRGAGAPELDLLGGPDARFERMMTRSRDGVEGYQYQVVIPFRTPMMKADEPRHFSWIVRSEVSEDFFKRDGKTRTVGFRPSRGVDSARVAVQFASGTAPKYVAVVTNAPIETSELFDPNGETLTVVDDYVEKTWHQPRVARYSNLVWPR